METLKIQVKGQLLTVLTQDIIASGDINIDRCEFSFNKDWQGYVKTGVFYQDKSNVQYAVLDEDNTCVIPAAAMAKEGDLHIGVFGINGPALLTSTVGIHFIKEGAISGADISTDPSDDVFLAIIAQYQRIAELMHKYQETAQQFINEMNKQNKILETLNAFDVVEIKERLDIIEGKIIEYNDQVKHLIDREIIIRDVPIRFVDGVCEIQNDIITSKSLCDVYFDEYSFEYASKSLILVSSYDGYICITSSVPIDEDLTASILIRGY